MNTNNVSFALPQNRVSTTLTLHVHIGSANYGFFVPLAMLRPRINHHQSGTLSIAWKIFFRSDENEIVSYIDANEHTFTP